MIRGTFLPRYAARRRQRQNGEMAASMRKRVLLSSLNEIEMDDGAQAGAIVAFRLWQSAFIAYSRSLQCPTPARNS